MTSTCARRQSRYRANPRDPGRFEPSLLALKSNGPRERAIFKLIAEGGTNRSAAAYLNLSAKTVEKHRASLMRKLRLNSAVELALLAVDLGLVNRPNTGARSLVAAGAVAEPRLGA